MTKHSNLLVTAALTLVLAAGCSSGKQNPSSGTESPKASTSSTTSATSSAPTTSAAGAQPNPGAPAPAPGKVSANKATLEELTTAITNAGVPAAEAGRWAQMVVDNRPYANQEDMARLKAKAEAAKVDPAVVQKLAGVLAP